MEQRLILNPPFVEMLTEEGTGGAEHFEFRIPNCLPVATSGNGEGGGWGRSARRPHATPPASSSLSASRWIRSELDGLSRYDPNLAPPQPLQSGSELRYERQEIDKPVGLGMKHDYPEGAVIQTLLLG